MSGWFTKERAVERVLHEVGKANVTLVEDDGSRHDLVLEGYASLIIDNVCVVTAASRFDEYLSHGGLRKVYHVGDGLYVPLHRISRIYVRYEPHEVEATEP